MRWFSRQRRDGPVRTDLWCHDCQNDFSVDLDYGLDGNHVIYCPHCNHEHCRVIRNGEVTGDRWDSRNRGAYTYGSGGGSSAVTFGTVYLSATTSSTTTTSTIWVTTA